MSNRYKGAVISATPPTTTGGESGTASGAWTLEQQMQLQAAGLWPAQPTGPYIEEVFSTYLYTGTGAALTITNNIDLSTKGGLVWGKNRSTDATFGQNYLSDTSRGITSYLVSNSTDQQFTPGNVLTSANTTGFSIGDSARLNNSGVTYVSWTFRKQPKFFDIVTYTGNGSARTIAHNLGSVPGCMIIKDCTNAGSAWAIYHISQGNTKFLQFTTSAAGTSSGYWNNTTPTSTEFTVGTNGNVNQNGATYVAYLFAHDAGGFGLTGTDNVISCGSFSGSVEVNLGYEAQWILFKDAAGGDWIMQDIMRGMSQTQGLGLFANTAGAESNFGPFIIPTATGFKNVGGGNYIYIAIRRGPMRVPTDATKVFTPQTRTGTGSAATITGVGFSVDLVIDKPRIADTGSFEDRLRGSTQNLVPSSTGAETTSNSTWDVTSFASMDGISVGISGNVNINTSGTATVNWFFRRAPSFFDEVCYTGTGANTTFTHNLGVVPELLITKNRTSAGYGWLTYSATLGATKFVQLNSTAAEGTVATYWNNTAPTSSVFSVGTAGATNASGDNFVAYLFATCAGVSKVGSYTGTATTLQIDCGFTAGSRFVLIKRTDSTGDWYVWDSARGIVAGNDPYLLLNSTAAEVTNTDYVDTYNAGFEISSTAPAAINANGGTYIFLAIA